MATTSVSCAAIIAGGASRRMGTPKALLQVGGEKSDGETLIARIAKVLVPRFDEVVVVTRDKQIAAASVLPCIPDALAGKGPLSGITSALSYLYQPTFCVSCDLPFLDEEVIQFLCAQLKDYDAVVPRINGRNEALHAVYSPSCLTLFDEVIRRERIPGFKEILSLLNTRFVKPDELRRFDAELKFLTNLNTPEDLLAANLNSRAVGLDSLSR